MPKIRTLVFMGAASAAAQYFLDPEQGTRRRNIARDRALALLRRGKQEATRRADYLGGQAAGVAHQAREKVTPAQPKEELTDQDLARKVETVIFREADVPKGKINVDAVERTVTLRGEAETQEMIEELERKTSEIPEVERVENLLHLPGEPAPTRADTPERQKA
jgi:osmotically-inducible protein OsmY